MAEILTSWPLRSKRLLRQLKAVILRIAGSHRVEQAFMMPAAKDNPEIGFSR
jgi:hypothetical protein